MFLLKINRKIKKEGSGDGVFPRNLSIRLHHYLKKNPKLTALTSSLR